MEKSFALRMYYNMVTLQTMDALFFEAQRQGRFSFYLTTIGEEAINIASAAALHDDDIVYAQVCSSIFKMSKQSGFSIHTLNCRVRTGDIVNVSNHDRIQGDTLSSIMIGYKRTH